MIMLMIQQVWCRKIIYEVYLQGGHIKAPSTWLYFGFVLYGAVIGPSQRCVRPFCTSVCLRFKILFFCQIPDKSNKNNCSMQL